MNRNEFMEKLERLLTGIPVDEREAALQYYTDILRMPERSTKRKSSANLAARKRLLLRSKQI